MDQKEELAIILEKAWHAATGRKEPRILYDHKDHCAFCDTTGKLSLFVGFYDVDYHTAAMSCQNCFLDLMKQQPGLYEKTQMLYVGAFGMSYELGYTHAISEVTMFIQHYTTEHPKH